MQSVVICSCAADVYAVREARHFLETNCPALLLQSDAVAASAEEMLDTVDSALSADLVLVLLSPHAIPTAWARAHWEPVLLKRPREFGTAVAYLLLAPCRFPEVLRRQKFFDLSTDRLDGMRKVKRWLIEQDPLRQDRIDCLPPRQPGALAGHGALNDLQRRVADAPGAASGIEGETALEFAHTHWQDFANVIWIDCSGRSYAGILGDTAQALGLTLNGSTGQNRLALHSFASRSRCLYIFDGLDERHHNSLRFGGNASVIFTAVKSSLATERPSLDQLTGLFAHWRRDPAICLQHLGDAAAQLERLEHEESAETSLAIKQLGVAVFSLLQQYGRPAEANEVAEALSMQAWREGDLSALHRWEWEKSWIQELWGAKSPQRVILGGVAQEPAQLDLF